MMMYVRCTTVDGRNPAPAEIYETRRKYLDIYHINWWSPRQISVAHQGLILPTARVDLQNLPREELYCASCATETEGGVSGCKKARPENEWEERFCFVDVFVWFFNVFTNKNTSEEVVQRELAKILGKALIWAGQRCTGSHLNLLMFGNRSVLFGRWGYLQHRWVGPAFRNTHTHRSATSAWALFIAWNDYWVYVVVRLYLGGLQKYLLEHHNLTKSIYVNLCSVFSK